MATRIAGNKYRQEVVNAMKDKERHCEHSPRITPSDGFRRVVPSFIAPRAINTTHQPPFTLKLKVPQLLFQHTPFNLLMFQDE